MRITVGYLLFLIPAVLILSSPSHVTSGEGGNGTSRATRAAQAAANASEESGAKAAIAPAQYTPPQGDSTSQSPHGHHHDQNNHITGDQNSGSGSGQGSRNTPPPPPPNPKPFGCLIATAAFGSELTPQVQYLRNFRDHYILSTNAGSSFMKVFNTWYYSLSPYIADYERHQPWLQETVKTSIYPLFG